MLACLTCGTKNETSALACVKCGSSLLGPRRAPLLTGLLTLSVLGNCIALVGIVGRVATVPAARSGYALADILIVATLLSASLLGIAGVWQWKRWGVYLFFGASLLSIAVVVLFGVVTWRVVLSLAIVVLIAVLVHRQWSSFGQEVK